MEEKMKRVLFIIALVLITFAFNAPHALAQTDKPNILVIWGDDVGMYNISALYHLPAFRY